MKTATTTLILCVGSLMGLGIVMLYSSSMARGGTHYLTNQAAWSVAGTCACLIAALVDYRILKKFSWIFLVLTILALIGVLIPGVGVWKNGSRRWFNLGVANFQPSEAAKLALVIMLAYYGERYQRDIRAFWKGLIVPSCIALAVLAPIFIEPDRGTTILLGTVTALMLLLAGVRWIYFIPPGLGAVAFMAYMLISDPMRLARIMSWLHPEETKDGVGYQSWQAMIALGSGGVSGLGLGEGRQKHGFVPENHTDFILSLVGEEMGLIATLAVVCAFIIFILCGIYVAWHARDVFGLLLGSGITFLIGLQAFINIGVVTSALPNKGLPLPFVSYGGSSLMLMLLAVGVLISIARHGGPPALPEDELEDLRHTQFA
ncbi:MAG TPA: putative lipid II flippase FtsW [Verrucomicrobiae bacterium]|nr:putative lipid II flippase FtsW [Verrucomicrobiae bacterium]